MQSILVQVIASLRLLKVVEWDVGDVKKFLLLNFMQNYNLHSTSLKSKGDKDKGQPIIMLNWIPSILLMEGKRCCYKDEAPICTLL